MDTESIFTQRRSVKYFDKDKKLDMDLLKNIINTAVLCPSAYNFQPWHIIAVESDESKKKLYKLSGNQQKILDAPATLIIAGDRKGYDVHNPIWKSIEEKLGIEKVLKIQKSTAKLYGETEEKRIKFGESNASLLGMSIMYAAKIYGVDTHPVGGIDFKAIKKEFEIKDAYEVVFLICMGYKNPEKDIGKRKPRKKFDEIVTLV